MLEDILYKLARKIIPRTLYAGLSRRLNRNHHRPENFAAIYGHYRGQGLKFGGKTVLELGSGNQFITALFYLREGAERVLLVDPKLKGSGFPAQARTFRRFTGTAPEPDAFLRIQCYAGLKDVPSTFDNRVDILCSHLVLEHVGDLAGCFADQDRLLSAGGQAYHLVDLSDHTYHVFGKFPFTRLLAGNRTLYHLRYSNSLFDRMNDGRTYVNRILLPGYLELARKHHLEIRALRKIPHQEVPIHPDLRTQNAGCDPRDLYLAGFALKLARSGLAPGLTSPARI